MILLTLCSKQTPIKELDLYSSSKLQHGHYIKKGGSSFPPRAPPPPPKKKQRNHVPLIKQKGGYVRCMHTNPPSVIPNLTIFGSLASKIKINFIKILFNFYIR